MALWNSPRLLFKAKLPELKKFIGRTIEIDGEKIQIETIQGSMGMNLRGKNSSPAFYEINGKYVIGMLRFHCRMDGCEKEFSEDVYRAFEETTYDAEKIPTEPAS